ncbi:hypothetical protein Tco_1331992, partial [Tanacetum coccineum]
CFQTVLLPDALHSFGPLGICNVKRKYYAIKSGFMGARVSRCEPKYVGRYRITGHDSLTAAKLSSSPSLNNDLSLKKRGEHITEGGENILAADDRERFVPSLHCPRWTIQHLMLQRHVISQVVELQLIGFAILKVV